MGADRIFYFNSHMHLHQSHLNFITQYIIQCMQQMCKVSDEVVVVTHLSYFSVSLQHWKLHDGIHILLTWPNSFNGDVMFFFCMPKDDHIIQINDAIRQIELSQCILHQMLECCGCVIQSKGHPGKFIETKVANHECGVYTVVTLEPCGPAKIHS